MRAERSSFAPRPLNAEYYGQRATAGGLIIAEASPVAATGRGNPATPGIYSDQQVEGWRKVVDAVHGKGGFIFLQLWHVGRVSHSSLQPGGVLPVAPSAVPITGEGMLAMTASGKPEPYETPRALETHEITEVIEAFREGARNAFAAGFDGVEIPRRQRLSARAIFAVAHQSAHRSIWRIDRQPHAAVAGDYGCRDRHLGRGPRRGAAVTLRRRQWQRRARSDAALQPCDPHAWMRSALPTCISSNREAAAPAAPRSTIRTYRRL